MSDSNANISAEKNKQTNKQKTIFIELRSFELDGNFSSFKTAIYYRRNFNLTKFSKSVLNFVFILLARVLLISSRLADNPENRIGKNCIRNKLKCRDKRLNEE